MDKELRQRALEKGVEKAFETNSKKGRVRQNYDGSFIETRDFLDDVSEELLGKKITGIAENISENYKKGIMTIWDTRDIFKTLSSYSTEIVVDVAVKLMNERYRVGDLFRGHIYETIASIAYAKSAPSVNLKELDDLCKIYSSTETKGVK